MEEACCALSKFCCWTWKASKVLRMMSEYMFMAMYDVLWDELWVCRGSGPALCRQSLRTLDFGLDI